MPRSWYPALTLAVAAILPLAGVVLAGVRFMEHRKDEAVQLLLAAVLGAVIWFL